MDQLVLLGTIAAGVGLALFTSKIGLQLLVNSIPMKQPKN